MEKKHLKTAKTRSAKRMLSRVGNYFFSNFKLITNLVSNQYHRANPAPKSTVFATKNQVCEIIPTRQVETHSKLFCIDRLIPFGFI